MLNRVKGDDGIKMRLKLDLKSKIIMISVVPMLVLSFILSTYMAYAGYKNACDNVYHELHTTCVSVYEFVLSESAENASILLGEDDYQRYSGIFDGVKKNTEVDITVFNGDTRSITTVTNENGEKIVGTKASDDVIAEVIEGGKEYFSDDVEVDGVRFFGYYMPVYSLHGEVLGMTFAGRSRAEVQKSIFASIRNAVFISLVSTLLIFMIALYLSGSMVKALESAVDFMNRIADGDTSCAADKKLTDRYDEIGDMGRSAVKLQRSIRTLISTDPLTGLMNRRSCNIKLNDMYSHDERYVAVMSDIDHFKAFNDLYGHFCGDDVLKFVSGIFLGNIEGKGCAARWGGEEFLMILSCTEYEALEIVRKIQAELEESGVPHGDQKLKVTMTFGVQASERSMLPEEVIRLADEKLYYGKNHGRNCIVTKC
jgi:diguanylate cyclase (GGDEF)-like protein